MKKFSIITINYNNCAGLRKTIESVVNQTYTDFEYIVIDGGSTDGSAEVIREYAERIDYWVSEPDKGIYNAMNKGILKATGEYLNFMNSGDCFYTMEALASVSCFTDDLIMGNIHQAGTNNILKYKSNMSLYDLCIYGINHQATFFKRHIFEKRLYDETLKIMADWKLAVECIVFDECSFRYVDILLVEYDMTGISFVQRDLAEREKKQILKSLLPSQIYVDYEMFSQIRTPILGYLPYLSKTYLLNKMVVFYIKLLVKCHLILKKTNK